MAWYVDGLDDGRIRRWTSIAVDDDDAASMLLLLLLLLLLLGLRSIVRQTRCEAQKIPPKIQFVPPSSSSVWSDPALLTHRPARPT